jgi:hypothetical protein
MPELYRKRLVPQECVHLHKDTILFRSQDYLITGWDTINPKVAFSKGISLYVIDKGWKISKFYDHNNNFVYWYCDIIDTDYDKETDTYVFTDLLADVIIEPSGKMKVVDLDEYETAFKNNLINCKGIIDALNKLNALLCIIDSGEFSEYAKKLEAYEK